MFQEPIRFLGACMGLGAQIRDCEKGPLAIKSDIEMLYPNEHGDILHRIHQFNLLLANTVNQSIQLDQFPVVIGGDHSIAVGTWNGVRKAISKPLSLIWVDAHLDGHTPETTPSNAFHGMPTAALLGFGDPKMSQLLELEPVLSPENLFIIGARSFEWQELQLLQRLKVKIYWIDEVKNRGFLPILKEVINQIQTPHIGLSLDLDFLDPIDAPGVGSPAPDGICADELISALPFLKEKLVAFELVEYNPCLDIEFKTRNLAVQILESVLYESVLFSSC